MNFRIQIELGPIGFAIHRNGGWIQAGRWSACALRQPQPCPDAYKINRRRFVATWGNDG